MAAGAIDRALGGVVMTRYLCDDGNAELEIEADTPEEAAREYVDIGDWGDIDSTIWLTIYVTPKDGDPDRDRQAITVDVDPVEPACSSASGHEWADRSGPLGHGGGVIYTESCVRCGGIKTMDSWAMNPETGEQGLSSIAYSDADEQSLAACVAALSDALTASGYDLTDGTVTVAIDDPEDDDEIDRVVASVRAVVGDDFELDHQLVTGGGSPAVTIEIAPSWSKKMKFDYYDTDGSKPRREP